MKRISITTLGFAAMMAWFASSSTAWSAPSPTWEKKDLALHRSSCAEGGQCKTQTAPSRPAILLAWGNDDCSNTNISVSFRTIGSVDRPMLSPPYPCSYLPAPDYDYSAFSRGRSGYLPPAPPEPASDFHSSRSFEQPMRRRFGQPSPSPERRPTRGLSQCWNFTTNPSACRGASGCFWDAYLHQCRPYSI